MANNGQATKQEPGWKDFKNRSIRVLLVEDSENDALLLLRHLQKGGYEPISQRVETAAAMLAALEQQSWDIIISDYVVPGFGGLEALALLQNKGLDLPFIIVSGHIGEEVAVEAMKAGAHDYVMKDNLRRLVPAVERELREAEIRCQRKKAEQQLKSTAQELGWTVEELRKTEEQLRARNEELLQARDELEMRVANRTAALSKLNAKLRQQIEERRRLEQELLDITEQERQRIGIDLHDDLGQQLTGIAFMLKGLQQKLQKENPARAAEAGKIHSQVCHSIQHAHDVALDLASDYQGIDLSVALNQLAGRVQSLFGVACDCKTNGDLVSLQPGVAAHLYKITQEALTNAIKHGKARQIAVELTQEEQKLLLSVWNNGSPFPAQCSPKSRMGLRIMNYRAHLIGGALDVKSDEKKGTTVTCSLLLQGEALPGTKAVPAMVA